MTQPEQTESPDKNSLVVVEPSKISVFTPPTRLDLSNYRDIRLEMTRVYREYDRGKINEPDAKARHYMLSTLAQLIKATETDQRLEAIERAIKMRTETQRRTASAALPPFRKK